MENNVNSILSEYELCGEGCLKNDLADRNGELVERVARKKDGKQFVRRTMQGINKSCADLTRIKHNLLTEIYFVGYSNDCTYILEEALDIDKWKPISQYINLPKNEVIDVLINVCKGLQKLHSCGLVYQDVKPEHIMYNDKTKDVKLINYTKVWKKASGDSRICLNNKYSAPESLDEVKYSYGSPDYCSDIFSLGLVAKELIKREDLNNDKFLLNVLNMATEVSKNYRIPTCDDFIKLLEKSKAGIWRRFTAKGLKVICILAMLVALISCVYIWSFMN